MTPTHELRALLCAMEACVERAAQRATDDDGTPWQHAYAAIFSDMGNGRVAVLLAQIGQPLVYDDPDCSYEDDVRAYVRALGRLVAGLEDSPALPQAPTDPGPPSAESMRAELDALVDHITATTARALARGDEGAWQAAYAAVFSPHVSHRVGALLAHLGQGLDDPDPDSSYEQDVLAYERALRHLVAEMPRP